MSGLHHRREKGVFVFCCRFEICTLSENLKNSSGSLLSYTTHKKDKCSSPGVMLKEFLSSHLKFPLWNLQVTQKYEDEHSSKNFIFVRNANPNQIQSKSGIPQQNFEKSGWIFVKLCH